MRWWDGGSEMDWTPPPSSVVAVDECGKSLKGSVRAKHPPGGTTMPVEWLEDMCVCVCVCRKEFHEETDLLFRGEGKKPKAATL